jgi:hypothetical protein
MKHHEDDIPLSEEERELAAQGEALIAAAVRDSEAPQSLRESIERERERAQAGGRPSFWRRRALAVAGAALVVIAGAAVLVVGSGSGGSAAPTLAAVEAATRLEPAEPAPPPAGGDPPVLAKRVGAIEFPDWEEKFGWRAIGSRQEQISGRTVQTVYYRNRDGAELGYSIVAGEPLTDEPPGREVVRADKSYHVAWAGERTVVTWRQQGHTCTIVASAAVPAAKLVGLAASRNV